MEQVTGNEQMNKPEWVRERRPGPKEKYPFRTVEVGKSFYVSKAGRKIKYRSFKVLVGSWGIRLGRKFHCRECEDGRFEVWRET